MIMRILLSLGLAGTTVLAGAPDTGRHAATALSIRANPVLVTVQGDTTRIAYAVTNTVTSTAELFAFTVDAPVRVLRVEKPAPLLQWHVTRRLAGRSVASWSFIETQLGVGQTSPPLAYAAVGLPGLVTYWARVYVPPDTVEPPDVADAPRATGPGAFANDSGTTVGVVPFPIDRSRGALLARLGALLSDVCARGWIDNAGVCTSLRTKIEHEQTGALVNELDAQRGKHVNDLAYFLLVGNVQALPPSAGSR
jgi:hypothetical protein